MTVLRLIKGLIGAEDINLGDSSTTFNRETYTGGSVALRYIDAEVIPSTTLGGVIGDHLHVQNTDSLTKSTTFGINGAGTSVTLDASGLTAPRSFTFPDTGDQELVGDVDLASTAAGLGASLVGIADAGGYFTGADVEAITQELGADVDTLLTEERDRGRHTGFRLGFASVAAVTISGGSWGHDGTTLQYVWMSSAVTFTLGPGGSNARSDAPASNELHYIYIDDEAIVLSGTGELTASEFKNSTDIPVYDNQRHGWYASGATNTTAYDRCIGAILTNTSNEILEFSVTSRAFYRYASPVVEFTTASCGTTYQALNLNSSVPSFSTAAKIRVTNVNATTGLFFDTANTAVTPEALMISTANRAHTFDISLNSSQVVYFYGTADTNVDIDLVGYFIDDL
jgi:hypothetical protein